MSKQEFITKISALVQKHAPAYGIKCPSAIISQAILESGYGESLLAAKYHNYFGLKCGTAWKGRSVNIEEIMYGVQREIINQMLDCSIILIIDTLLDSIREYLGLSEDRIKELVSVFISKLPEVWRKRFTAPQEV